MKTIIHQPYAI